MPDIDFTTTLSIHAPVHVVFEYCRDPRSIFAGDPAYQVTDATVTPESVGTRGHLVAKMLGLSEDVAIEYVEVVPDKRIVYEARPTVTIAGRKLGAEVFTWAWAFLPAAGGTELTLRVANRGGARWERALDALGTQRVLTKQSRARLARIAAAVEGKAAPPG